MERGGERAQVRAVAVGLHGVLQLSQLLGDMSLMDVSPQSPTPNKAVVKSNHFSGGGTAALRGAESSRVMMDRCVVSTSWNLRTQKSTNQCSHRVHHHRKPQVKGGSKHILMSGGCDTCQVSRDSPVPAQQPALQHALFAFFPLARSKSFTEPLTVATTVGAAMMVQNAKLY